MTPPSHDAFAAFLGIDWADANHDICLQAAGTAQRAGFQREHTPEAIDAWGTTRRTRFQGQPVALCLALHTGPLVFALRTYDFLGLFTIQPLTVARSRAACTPSRAPEDPPPPPCRSHSCARIGTSSHRSNPQASLGVPSHRSSPIVASWSGSKGA